MTKRLSKYLTQFLNPKLVLGIDIVVSSFASLLTIGMATLMYARDTTVLYAISFVIVAAFGSAVGLLFAGTYRVIIRHTSLKDVTRFIIAIAIKGCILWAYLLTTRNSCWYDLVLVAVDFVVSLFSLLFIRLAMLLVYDTIRERTKNCSNLMNILVYGTGGKASSLAIRMGNSRHYNVVGFISTIDVADRTYMHDKPVYYVENELDFIRICEEKDVKGILFSHMSDVYAEQDRIVQESVHHHIKVLIAPSIEDIDDIDHNSASSKVREIKIEDLLGREEIKLNMEAIEKNFRDKVIMVTGAAGSIGSELVRQLAGFGVKKIILYDNAETPMHNLRLELEDKFPQLNFVPVIGNVIQLPRLDYAFRKWRPQVVFHAAAYKHVPLMEENPCEAVMTNVAGSRNVADKCIQYGVEKMVMISTDKAVNPTNIMGCTKRLAEIYVQSLGLAIEQGTYKMPEGSVVDKPITKFVTTRFGNVLGSNGSVIPRFREQIENGGPVTVTHPEIIRFFMTIPEACRLVMEAATMTDGNQIFVFDMGKPVKIDFLARRMIELAGLVPDKDIKIEYTGLRPGEKLYEEVLSDAETTIPTQHDRIRIAKVREYEYEDAYKGNYKLEELARAVDIPTMVKLMKQIVPEFKSKNSPFEEYDS
ncbi:MAG: polysaccharide biosynthesis protein [Bacteroidales bacterium]|nr:polysaccharide biosynthesis protein [Bacteroidales bacterium]